MKHLIKVIYSIYKSFQSTNRLSNLPLNSLIITWFILLNFNSSTSDICLITYLVVILISQETISTYTSVQSIPD